MNHKDLLQNFKLGNLVGISDIPEHIETIFSDIFIFKKAKKVYKIYFNDNDKKSGNYINLADKKTRSELILKDFEMNNFLNPETYLRLLGSEISEGKIKFIEPTKNPNDILIIEMNHVDQSQKFTNTLMQDFITPKNYFEIGRDFTQMKLSFDKKHPTTEKRSWVEILDILIPKMNDWIKHLKEVSEIHYNNITSKLESLVEINRENFKNNIHLSTTFDCNTENTFFVDGRLMLLDMYIPTPTSRITDIDFDLIRLGTDILILNGKKSFEKYKAGVLSQKSISFNDDIAQFYIYYGAVISYAYLHMINKDGELNKQISKYREFIESFE